MYDGQAPAAGIVTGIGVVEGRQCVIVANDATVKGGTYFPLTVKKHLRAQEVAEQNRLPCIYLVDSGGAFLPLQAEVFPDRDHFGRIFYNQARLSAAGIPQIAAVMGSCTAGGAYVPAMSDETIIVKGTGTIFIGGPPLVKAATGEEVTAEELGGADVHTRQSGVADYYAVSDEHALALCRQVVRNLGGRRAGSAVGDLAAGATGTRPADLYGLVPETFRSRSTRESSSRESSTAAASTSSRRRTARRSSAALPGSKASRWGSSRTRASSSPSRRGRERTSSSSRANGESRSSSSRTSRASWSARSTRPAASPATAQSSSQRSRARRCPKFTVITGGSFGAGNYGMCGRAYGPRQLWMWPNARISVMGGEQAALVLSTVGDTDPDEIRATYEREGNPYYSTARIWDDGIIDPLDTRYVLALGISAALNAPIPETTFGIFRM